MEDQVLIPDRRGTGRRRGPALAVVAVVSVTFSACGGSGDDDTLAGSAVPSPTATETTSSGSELITTANSAPTAAAGDTCGARRGDRQLAKQVGLIDELDAG